MIPRPGGHEREFAPPPGYLFESGQTSSGERGDADLAAVGFMNCAAGDYRVGPASKYRRPGTDGRDLGVDMAVLAAATLSASPAPAGSR